MPSKKTTFFALINYLFVLSSCQTMPPNKRRKVSTNIQNFQAPCNPTISGIIELLDPKLNLNYQCGSIKVPVRHSARSEVKLELEFVYFNPQNPNPIPMVMTQGGPGGSSTKLALSHLPILKEIIDKHGLLVFEYRGTDFTNPRLQCKVRPATNETDQQKLLQECAQYWNSKLDLSAINTNEITNDLMMITEALGFNRFHFYGVSYGTLIGQYALRKRPERLASVILDGTVPYLFDWNSKTTPENVKQPLARLFKECKNSHICSHMYGDLEHTYNRVLKKITQSYPNSTAKMIDHFVEEIFKSFYTIDRVQRLPSWLTYLADLKKWKAPLEIQLNFFQPIDAVYLSVYCTELQLLHQSQRSDFVIKKPIDQNCKTWFPKPTYVQKLPLKPIGSIAPVLFLSGYFDPITHDQLTEVYAEKDYEFAQHLISRNSGHGSFFQDACIRSQVLNFLKNPLQPINGMCNKEKNFPFLPMTNPNNQAELRDIISKEFVFAPDSGLKLSESGVLFNDLEIKIKKVLRLANAGEALWIEALKNKQSAYKIASYDTVVIGERKFIVIHSQDQKQQNLGLGLVEQDQEFNSLVFLSSKPSLENKKTLIEAVQQIEKSMGLNKL